MNYADYTISILELFGFNMRESIKKALKDDEALCNLKGDYYAVLEKRADKLTIYKPNGEIVI